MTTTPSRRPAKLRRKATRTSLSIAGLLLPLLLATPLLAHSGHVYVAGRGTPVVDGDLSDWPADSWQPIEDRHDSRRSYSGPEDLSASFAVLWSDGRLFLAAAVTDEIHSCDFAGWEIWQGDSIQWRLDLDHTPEGPATELEWGYALSTETGATESGRWSDEFTTLVEAAVVRDEEAGVTRYEAEISLPLEVEAARVVGLSVLVNDNDGRSGFPGQAGGGREGYLEWSSGIAVSKDRQLHGDLLLTGAAVGRGALWGKLRWEDRDDGIGRGRLRAQSTTTPLSVTLRTDRDGAFHQELPGGMYWLEAVQPGQDGVRGGRGVDGLGEAGFVIEPGGVHSVDLLLPARRGRAADAGEGTGVWQSFRIPDGLPHLFTLGVVEDLKGALWIATRGEGIISFDGTAFTSPAATSELRNHNIWSIFTDRDGAIWIGAEGGLFAFDGETLTSLPLGNEVVSIEEIAQDRHGNLWFGTDRKGLLRYDGEDFTPFGLEEGLSGVRVGDILEDTRGDLLVATTGGVSRFDGERFHSLRTVEGSIDVTITAVAEDSVGNLWLSGLTGVSRYDGATLTSFGVETGFRGNISVTRDGEVWVTSQDGVHRYNGREFRTFTRADGLVDDRVLSIFEDRSGNLWFSTLGGLSRYDPNTLVRFGEADGFPREVWVATQDRHGNLWFATRGEGLIRCDGQTVTTFTTDDGLAANWVVGVFEDSHGNIWAGTVDGLSRFSEGVFTTYNRRDGLAGDNANSILEDRDGNLWFGTWGHGLSRYDGEAFTTFDDELPGLFVTALAQDPAGGLWIGTTDGLSHFRGERFTTYTTDDGLAGDGISAITADDSGLWVGTSAGLSHFDGTAFNTFTTADGLVHNNISCLLVDERGSLWVGTSGGGVSRYDGNQFQSLLSADGLPGNAIRDIFHDADGNVWIATSDGIARYRPSRGPPPPVFIDAVVADRRYDSAEEVVRVPSTAGLIAFEYHGLSYKTRPGTMIYRYRLSGRDQDWQSTRERRVEYRDLPVGDYDFEVQAVDRDLTYSTTAEIQLAVYDQPTLLPLRLSGLALNDVFASFHQTYMREPLGSVRVHNDGTDSLTASLRLYLPEVMRRPQRQELHLPPRSSQLVDLLARFDADILETEGARTLEAEVSLSFEVGGQPLSIPATTDVTVYGPGALRWDSVARAAAFVTHTDPVVTGFARPLLAAFEEETEALGRPGRNLLQAMVLFEAVKEHGVRYVADPSTPYALVSADASAIDHVQYPAQTLGQRAGDCDDLAVLFCSLLESAGIATALVDYPEHVFALFDTGVPRDAAYQLPVDGRLYVERGDRLWVPVEVTQIGESFETAWALGAEELLRLPTLERRERVVDTREAWRQYPVSLPPAFGEVAAPDRDMLAHVVAAQSAALEGRVDVYIAKTYLDPLKLTPDNDALRTRLLQVYVALQRYDTAIDAGLNHLVDRQGDEAATHNHLGIANYLKGDNTQAVYHFQQASALRPDDAGIRANLDLGLRATGREITSTAVAAIDYAVTDSTKAGQLGAVDAFYWID